MILPNINNNNNNNHRNVTDFAWWHEYIFIMCVLYRLKFNNARGIITIIYYTEMT